jgi:hypothetical protein
LSAHPEYLTPRETASILRRSTKRLYAMIAADPTFPVTRLPSGGLLVPRVAFERWLHDRTQGMRGPLRPVVVTQTSGAPQRTAAPGALNGAANG